MQTTYPSALYTLQQTIADDGTKVFWADKTYSDPNIVSAQKDFAKPILRPEQLLLKQRRLRFIFLQPTESKAVVVKLFPLTTLSSKLRHRKYAYAEFVNTCHARSLSLPVPEAIAFLEKRKNGLVTCSGLVQENLEGATDLKIMQLNDGDFDHIARISTDMLKQAYEVGANHMDLRSGNIMLKPDTDQAYIIDWHYASFVPSRAPWLLEYLAAYYVGRSPEPLRERLFSEWVPQLYEACKHPLEFEAFMKRVEALMKLRPKKPASRVLKPIVGL